MLYPTIDKLLQQIPSKYSLIGLASKRAKEMRLRDDYQLTKYKSAKPVGKALEEVAQGKLYIVDDYFVEQTLHHENEIAMYAVSGQEEL